MIALITFYTERCNKEHIYLGLSELTFVLHS